MDIPRTEVKAQKRRRQIIYGVVAVVALAALTLGVSRLRPAAPTVERSTVWTDTVKRGPMLRQVRGLGTLIPVDIRWIPSETEARVERIVVLPGSQVQPDTVILELTNPQAEQEAVDAEWQLKAAEAEYKNTRVKLEGDLMNQQAAAATVNADYNDAKRKVDTDEELAKLGVISGLSLKSSRGKAEETFDAHEHRAETNRDQRKGDRLADGRAAGKGGAVTRTVGVEAEDAGVAESTLRASPACYRNCRCRLVSG